MKHKKKVFQACQRKELPTNTLQILDEIAATFTDMPEALYKALKKNIMRDGIRDPILVMHDETTVVGGSHRLRCAFELELKTVPCYVLPKSVDASTAYELGVLDNALRRRLSEWELAVVVHAMFELYAQPRGKPKAVETRRIKGDTRDIIASLLGISRDRVRYYRALTKLPEQIWPEISAGKISAANLKAIVAIAKEGKKQVKAGVISELELTNAIIATVRELVEFGYDVTWLEFKLSKRMKIIEQPKPSTDVGKKTQSKWLKLMRGNRVLERFIDQPLALKESMDEEDAVQMIDELREWSAKYLELAVQLENLYDD